VAKEQWGHNLWSVRLDVARQDNTTSGHFLQSNTKGATGFDGDQDATSACRALGDSLNLREIATANQELALAA